VNRVEAVIVPSFPLESTKTAAPPTTVCPLIPDMGCGDICVADPNGVTLAFHTADVVADIDIIIARARK
jgi:hypothetical protein